jgi:hypothetical protein
LVGHNRSQKRKALGSTLTQIKNRKAHLRILTLATEVLI